MVLDCVNFFDGREIEFQIAVPSRRVRFVSPSLANEVVKNDFEALSDLFSRVALGVPDRLQNLENIFRCDLCEIFVTDDRQNVSTNRAVPLIGVFNVAPLCGLAACFNGFCIVLGKFTEFFDDIRLACRNAIQIFSMDFFLQLP